MDAVVMAECNRAGNAIEMQAHDGAYSYARNETERIGTREGVARPARKLEKAFVAECKVDMDWKNMSAKREPQMKTMMFAEILTQVPPV